MTETILPCLWCKRESGGFPPRLNTANGTMHWVFCPECGMHGPSGIGEDKAIEHWNFICRPQSAPDKGAEAVVYMNPETGEEQTALERIKDLAGIALGSMVKGPDEDGDHWCGMCDAMLEDEMSGHKATCASRVLSDIFDIASRNEAPAQAPVARDAEAAADEITDYIGHGMLTSAGVINRSAEIAAIIRKHCK